MRSKIPNTTILKADIQIFVHVFFSQRTPTLELDFQELFTVDVLRDEICTLPIIR
ncbi:hypothetical protein [Nitrosomonas communis]|uniref:hypothetical protein n=1 Tax=Nitrosomonas communis TaxID=44574 RepID=UPI0021098DF1|nr:hypothetical protein [Nitrosomonas communis]